LKKTLALLEKTFAFFPASYLENGHKKRLVSAFLNKIVIGTNTMLSD